MSYFKKPCQWSKDGLIWIGLFGLSNFDSKIWHTLGLLTLQVKVQYGSFEMLPFDSHTFSLHA